MGRRKSRRRAIRKPNKRVGLAAKVALGVAMLGGAASSAVEKSNTVRAAVEELSPGVVETNSVVYSVAEDAGRAAFDAARDVADSEPVRNARAEVSDVIDDGLDRIRNVDLPDVGEVQETLRDVGDRASDVVSDVIQTVGFGRNNETLDQFLSVGGPENATNILRESERAQNALRSINMRPGDLYIAFVNDEGEIETFNFDDPKVRVSYDSALRMEDRYLHTERPDLRHVSTRHVTRQGDDRVYSPWDIDYDSSEVREEGARKLQAFVNEAYSLLNSIPSAAYSGKNVSDVITPEFLLDFFMAENISHENIDDHDLAVRRHNSLLVHLALNGNDAFKYRVSGVGASGPMQLMPAMYESLVNNPESHYHLSQRLGFTSDFSDGTTDYVTAFVVAACLLDDMVRSFKIYGRITADRPEQITDSNYAELAGAYLMGAPYYNRMERANTLPEDFYNYRAKYLAMNDLHN